ncbi:MAG: hypothetical protein MJZ24_01945 [Paludibacteraceae bacterium]|nr:hypothetical protein [Candidatus Physcocola equi]MCQ2233486.1 hypothetical protein [Paludibacteraceae bacterium]
MKKSLSILLFLLSMFLCDKAAAQVVHFKAYRIADGVAATNVVGSYSWGPWSPKDDDITLDLNNNSLFIGDKTYEIMEKPKKWIIKRDLKYVSISCSDKQFNKINIKLYQYDKGEFRIYVMGEKTAQRYSVNYID